MPNVAALLREEITRLSRREIRRETQGTKKVTAQHRHHIAALNRKMNDLEHALGKLVRQVSRQSSPAPEASGNGTGPRLRFAAKGLRSHRSRLGLSAGDFADLIGVSANSVYAWESGATTPRRAQVVKIAQLRGIGKREALSKLETVRTSNARPRKR